MLSYVIFVKFFSLPQHYLARRQNDMMPALYRPTIDSTTNYLRSILPTLTFASLYSLYSIKKYTT